MLVGILIGLAIGLAVCLAMLTYAIWFLEKK